ncbi:hypothetical protein GCM10022254_09410 [Actinomadura meridiana]|uniref:Uncharacterized protein n=1 Tax=Actinomadura meridiana TaxID=559626 RepID=A0ABP8BTQ1_9ACTN
MSSDQPSAQPATAELLALAAATRPADQPNGIDLNDLRGVIAEALESGKPWAVVMVKTAVMLAHPDEDVRDLRIALVDPLKLNPSSRRAHRTHF